MSTLNLNVSDAQKFLFQLIAYLDPAFGKKALSILKKSITKAVPNQLFNESISQPAMPRVQTLLGKFVQSLIGLLFNHNALDESLSRTKSIYKSD